MLVFINFRSLYDHRATMFAFQAPQDWGKPYPYSRKRDYVRNGAPISFIRDIRLLLKTKTPDWYIPSLVTQVLATINRAPEQAARLNTDEDPVNVVLYLAESFSDPMKLNNYGMKISPDPIPFVRSMIKEKKVGGELTVPAFGGFTARSEFEVLSGLSLRFLPEAPYSDRVYRPFGSFPEMLKNNGYQTYALHTYYDWFWNRKTIYKRIGIDKFIAHDDFAGAPYSGKYISDDALVSRMIQTSQQAKPPYFMFGITMSTHGPHESSISSDNFTVDYGPYKDLIVEDERNRFYHYVRLLRLADNAIKNLVHYYSTQKQKTIVVFFGDHLPAFKPTYSAANFVKDEETPENARNQYATPYFIWANFDTSKYNIKIPRQLSANFLLPLASQYLPVKLNNNFRFARMMMERFAIFSQHMAVPRSDANPFAAGQISNEALEQQYNFLTYDIVVGRQMLNNAQAIQ